MIAALLGWTKLPQWAMEAIAILIAVAAVSLGILYWHHTIVVATEARDRAAMQAASQAAQAAAQKQIDRLNAQHATDVAKLKVDDEQRHEADLAQHNSDLERLHQFDAYRRAHEKVGSASSGPANPPNGGSGPTDFISILSRLEPVASGLADSTRQTATALTLCMQERDSLTGK